MNSQPNLVLVRNNDWNWQVSFNAAKTMNSMSFDNSKYTLNDYLLGKSLERWASRMAPSIPSN
jgi:hypothetical protein